MAIEARKHLRDVPFCPHGSLSDRERMGVGKAGAEIIDFSASCNPLGTAPGVRSALANIDFTRYPDDDALELRQALASHLAELRHASDDPVSATVGAGLRPAPTASSPAPLAPEIGPEWLAVGNGSVELMWLLASAFLDPGDPALVLGPTFGEYVRACRIVAASVQEARASEERSFRWEVDGLRDLIFAHRPKLAFLCNPNNPTGQLLSAEEVAQMLEVCEETLLVVDEAYLPFCDPRPDLLPLLRSERLLILRSMTKDYGLAGLRLGYAIAPPALIDAVHRVRPPWNVSAAAQAAGIAALQDDAFIEESRAIVRESRAFLSDRLSTLGLQVVPSSANFLLVKVGDGARFRAALLSRGVCVRDCASFGLPGYVRIGVRTLPECGRLVEAVAEVLGSD